MYEGNVQIVGRCSICGGAVVIPAIWHGVHPPVPMCQKCGATHYAEDTMPVIPMRPRKFRVKRWRNDRMEPWWRENNLPTLDVEC